MTGKETTPGEEEREKTERRGSRSTRKRKRKEGRDVLYIFNNTPFAFCFTKHIPNLYLHSRTKILILTIGYTFSPHLTQKSNKYMISLGEKRPVLEKVVTRP